MMRRTSSLVPGPFETTVFEALEYPDESLCNPQLFHSA